MTATALLVFARCAGFAAKAPVFGHPAVPRPVRVAIALLLAIVIAPGAPSPSAPDGIALVVAAACEALLGAAVGTAASLLYDAAYAGGRAIDDYIGVKAIAPSVDLVAPSGFGRLWSNAFTATYVLTGAYRPVLWAFSESFRRIPPGALPEAHRWLEFALRYASTVLGIAAAVAAPAIALAFLVQIALGALSRAIPRFGSTTLAFPLVFGAAIVVTLVALPPFALQAEHPLFFLP